MILAVPDSFCRYPVNRLSVWGKGEKIASRGKEKGESLQSTLIVADTVGTSS